MIEDLIGKPFVNGGRGPDEFDCWGLVKWIYKHELNIDLPDYAINAYDSSTIHNTVKRDRQTWLEAKTAEKYDLCLFSLNPIDQNFITHVGMSMGGSQFIHVIRGHNVSIAKLRNHYWSLRYKGAVRWQG